jgi:hypothetical protein
MVSSVLLYINFFGTLFLSRQPAPESEVPIETVSSDRTSPLWLERWGLWFGVLGVLLLIAYGPVFAEVLDFQEGWNILRYMPTSNAPMP